MALVYIYIYRCCNKHNNFGFNHGSCYIFFVICCDKSGNCHNFGMTYCCSYTQFGSFYYCGDLDNFYEYDTYNICLYILLFVYQIPIILQYHNINFMAWWSLHEHPFLNSYLVSQDISPARCRFSLYSLNL